MQSLETQASAGAGWLVASVVPPQWTAILGDWWIWTTYSGKMDVWDIQEPLPPTGGWHELGKLGEAMLGPAGLWAGGLVWGLPGHGQG